MISAADLALFQQTAGLTRVTPCTISRNTPAPDAMGGQTASWATILTTSCRVFPAPQTAIIQLAEGRLGEVLRWTIALPPGTDVTFKDRIIANGVTYEVAAVLSPRTFEIERIVQAEVIL